MSATPLSTRGGYYQCVLRQSTHLPRVTHLESSDLGLIILHTLPGDAQSVASFLDQKYVNPVSRVVEGMLLGTVAGDDTILLIPKSKALLQKVLQHLQQDFPYLLIE